MLIGRFNLLDDLLPPPTSEEEEIRRRKDIRIAELVAWYIQHGISLDVPLFPYRVRGEHGEST
jgi:hypothetical protein